MQRFAFDFGPLSLPLRLLGIGPRTSFVEISDGQVDVRFGPLRVRTPVDNILDAQVTGPYNPLTALGVRISASDRGLTFGTTTAGGVCIRFRRPVTGVLPVPFLAHPGLTVTVESRQALRTALLEARDGEVTPPAPPTTTRRKAAPRKAAPRKAAPRKSAPRKSAPRRAVAQKR